MTSPIIFMTDLGIGAFLWNLMCTRLLDPSYIDSMWMIKSFLIALARESDSVIGKPSDPRFSVDCCFGVFAFPLPLRRSLATTLT